MRLMSAEQVHSQKVAELGLDAEAVDLTATESLAAALRRAAAFLCPCSRASLVRAVVQPLEDLVADLNVTKEAAETALEAIVGYGDLLEHDAAQLGGQGKGVLLYPAPPSFVLRQSGGVLLIGIASDDVSGLPPELESRIEYVNHVRRLAARDGEDLGGVLAQLGLVELPSGRWLKAPPLTSAAQCVERYGALLDGAPPSGSVPGLTVLDPERPVRYYRGRWAEPGNRSGRFVARRPQAFGADLWCYAQLRDGLPEKFIDLPAIDRRRVGYDEAWWLQMAIDAVHGKPQRFRVKAGPAGNQVLEFYSPVPTWARRRWDSIGEPVMSAGSLFAYRFDKAEMGEELEFARQALWLTELGGNW
ncbi:MAG: hypothetical protein IT352_16120 [Gemmatimonadales bacterium]|nr:hypothetical protein [Gemmatimonadales bacterium]